MINFVNWTKNVICFRFYTLNTQDIKGVESIWYKDDIRWIIFNLQF